MANAETQHEAVLDALDNVAKRLAEEREYLASLDSAIGGADHGANIKRDFGKAADKREEFVEMGPNEVIKNVGTALISNIGEASGPLYGDFIVFASQELENGITAKSSVTFTEAYLDKVKDRDGAQVSAKTIVDALAPAIRIYKKSTEQDDLPPLEALAKTVDAAGRGVAFTVPVKAVKDHASFLDWRSVDHQDPGAAGTLFILEEFLETAEECLDGEVNRDTRVENAVGRGE